MNGYTILYDFVIFYGCAILYGFAILNGYTILYGFAILNGYTILYGFVILYGCVILFICFVEWLHHSFGVEALKVVLPEFYAVEVVGLRAVVGILFDEVDRIIGFLKI